MTELVVVELDGQHVTAILAKNPRWTEAHISHIEAYQPEYGTNFSEQDLETLRREVAAGTPRPRAPGAVVYEIRVDGDHAGDIVFLPFEDGSAEMETAVFRPFQGSGYARTVVPKVLEAVCPSQFATVEGVVRPGNRKANRVRRILTGWGFLDHGECWIYTPGQ